MTRILIVDDQEAVRYELSSFFEDQGYEIIEASSGSEFVEKIREDDSIDLVILDYHMSDCNGLMALEKVRKLPSGPKLKVLMLTTETSREVKELGKKLGLKGWLIKPFNLTLMKNAMDKIINS